MRKTMLETSLQELADSIKDRGQINPGIVIAFTHDEAVKYLKQVNKLWGTHYNISHFRPVYITEKSKEFYLFLVAGHRRLKATQMAKLETFYCQLRFDNDFFQAITLQLQENYHEEVPPAEQAHFLAMMWRVQKEADVGLTLTKFAKGHNKSPDAVRRSVRFHSLPVKVQDLVLPSDKYKKGVAFGLLCELARWQEARIEKEKSFSEQELIYWAYTFVSRNLTVKKAAMFVTEQIKELNGQSAMFELSAQEAVDSSKKTVATGLEQTITTSSQHLQAVARFHESGAVDKVASQSAVSATEKAIRLITTTAPDIISGVRGGRGAGKVKTVLGR